MLHDKLSNSKWCVLCDSGPFDSHYLYCPFDNTELKTKNQIECNHPKIDDNGCCLHCGEDIKPECQQ